MRTHAICTHPHACEHRVPGGEGHDGRPGPREDAQVLRALRAGAVLAPLLVLSICFLLGALGLSPRHTFVLHPGRAPEEGSVLTAFAPCSRLTEGPVGSAWAHAPFRKPLACCCLAGTCLRGTRPFPLPLRSALRHSVLGVACGVHVLPTHSLCGLGESLTSGDGSTHPPPRLPCGFSGTSLAERRVNAHWPLVLRSSEASRLQGHKHEPRKRPALFLGLTVGPTVGPPYRSIFCT